MVAAAPERPGAAPAVHHEAADGPGHGLPRFPIAEYDNLWAAQIVPLLSELDDGELGVVEARERGGRHRAAVLDAVAAARAGEHPPEVTSRAPRAELSVDGADDGWAPAAGSRAPDAASAAVEQEPSAEELAEPVEEPGDWSGVGRDTAVGAPVEGPEPVTPGRPHVRTFLGRRQSPVVIQRD